MIDRLESLLADASLPCSRFLDVTQRCPLFWGALGDILKTAAGETRLMREVISPSNVTSPGARSSSQPESLTILPLCLFSRLQYHLSIDDGFVTTVRTLKVHLKFC